jgi:hypothetical protein
MNRTPVNARDYGAISAIAAGSTTGGGDAAAAKIAATTRMTANTVHAARLTLAAGVARFAKARGDASMSMDIIHFLYLIV